MSFSSEVVQKEINKAFEGLFQNYKDLARPHVCCVCDKFMKREEVSKMPLDLLEEKQQLLYAFPCMEEIDQEIVEYYTSLEGKNKGRNERIDWDTILLSPSSTFIERKGRSKEGLACCRTCVTSLKKDLLPPMAIANGYYFGQAPKCLSELTEIELAFLTPIKTFGYCFCYSGGVSKQLKGTLCYFKVEMKKIAEATMNLVKVGLTENIIVLLHGNMTEKQRERARKKSKVRVWKIVEALKWLNSHNMHWKKAELNLEEIRSSIQNLVLIDSSILVESSSDGVSHSNIEEKETFQIFFPDCTNTTIHGGKESIDDFQELVHEAKTKGFKIEYQADLFREVVNDFRGRNLTLSCILQFPYGHGGPEMFRQNGDGSTSEHVNISVYADHLSRISQPHFHRELFVLILYSMKSKMTLFQSASLRVRSKRKAGEFSNQMCPEEFERAILRRKERTSASRFSFQVEDKFIKDVDAVARALPHTNGAAKKARQNLETLCHYFGLPAWFLTVTPDDNNSFIVEVMARKSDLSETKAEELTDEELNSLVKKRVEMRLRHPGICAFAFEMVIDTIIETVIGWNRKKNEPNGKGLFHNVDAFTCSVEEQGRRSLHAHFLIFSKEICKLRSDLHSSSLTLQEEAENKLCRSWEVKSCTKFFFESAGCRGTWDAKPSARIFDHECLIPKRKRKLPKVVDDQGIRELRMNNNGIFATCEHCPKVWTNTELVTVYLKKGMEVPGESELYQDITSRLKASCVDYQKGSISELPAYLVQGGYNHHRHSKYSCFKECQNGTGSRKQICECRYRYPKRASKHTKIVNATAGKFPWYLWHGKKTERYIKEAIRKRGSLDVFQNVCCKPISHSKLTCNSNLSLIMDGPVGWYNTKYNMKQTQQDDRVSFEEVGRALERTLKSERKHEKDYSEAMRRLLTGCFAHQKASVVGGPMCSFLTKNKSRFIFSHEFSWCPLRDIESLLEGLPVSSCVVTHGEKSYFQNNALHYLCRPKELEDLCAHDFYSMYEVVRMSRKEKGSVMKFSNGHFTHPSYCLKGKRFMQGVRVRPKPVLVNVFQFEFPDSAQLGGNLLEENYHVCFTSEVLARKILLLFLSYRTKEDLLSEDSYTIRLQEAVRQKQLSSKADSFLQNLQDCKANNTRVTKLSDDLERCTVTPQQSTVVLNNALDEEVLEDENELMANERLDKWLKFAIEESHPSNDSTIPDSFDLKKARNRGSLLCGYKNLCLLHETYSSPLIRRPEYGTLPAIAEETVREEVNERKASKKDIVCLLLSKKHVRRRNISYMSEEKEEDNNEKLLASGSARSIVDWAKAGKLDLMQKRAFEIITANFVLTYFTEAEEGIGSEEISIVESLIIDDINSTKRVNVRQEFNKAKTSLRKLGNYQQKENGQLICLLHGPGGSGKSTVIDLVVEYAREYCNSLKVVFNHRTICVTALTGVAATILKGETLHMAAFLNQKKELEQEQLEEWSGTRILIVDEISFASKQVIIELDNKLRVLKERLDKKFGGLHVVFAGDFRQLEPVGNNHKALYKDSCAEFEVFLNTFIELVGMHRFKDDPMWGMVLMRFRNGTVTVDDIEKVNGRLKESSNLPPNLRYATYYNRDRDAINAGLFKVRAQTLLQREESLDDMCLIFMSDLVICNASGVYIPFPNCRQFWEDCSENDLAGHETRTSRVDPVLKLFKGCRLMLPANENVREGRANGTQALLEEIVLNEGEVPKQIKLDGKIPMNALYANQVEYIKLRHCNTEIKPNVFEIRPKKHNFPAKIPLQRSIFEREGKREVVKMKGFQLPVILNSATTGHKLQGCGVTQLFIHNWSYVQNWVYVMLSRVKTLRGLFIRNPLSKDLTKYQVPKELMAMIAGFKKLLPTFWSEEEYEEFL